MVIESLEKAHLMEIVAVILSLIHPF